jgi:Uma2 family endonuclease
LDDFVANRVLHNDDAIYLKCVFKTRLERDPESVVLSRCRVDWNLRGVRPLAPDIAVFAGVKRRKNWATLDVAAEGARPVLVVEVRSAHTRTNDVDVKPDYYLRAGVPLFVIADVLEESDEARRLELVGYRFTLDGYQRIAPNAQGWIWLDPLDLWLGIVQHPSLVGCERLACFDGETRDKIGDYNEVTARVRAEAAARQKAEAESLQAEARVREPEEALRRLGQSS